MTSLRQALRAATEAAHQSLETTMSLDPATLTIERYGRALQVLHAVRAGWEPALARFLEGAQGPHLNWLEADFGALRLRPLPAAPAPPLVSEAEAWGFSYVLEGSALGGRSMLQNLAKFGLTAEHGARYFAGRGKETGAHWADFLERLEAQAGVTHTPAIIRAAQDGFAQLEFVARCALGSRWNAESIPPNAVSLTSLQ